MRMFKTAFLRPGARLAALVGLAVAAICPAGAFALDQFAPDAFGTYQPNAENGKVMFNAAGCGACHGSGDNTELLSGGMEMETAIGKFFAPNISAHPNGIGGWSNADFLNAVMVGLDREELFVAVVLAGLPSAQNVFTYAQRYQTGVVVARDTVLVTTVLSVPVLVLVAGLLA